SIEIPDVSRPPADVYVLSLCTAVMYFYVSPRSMSNVVIRRVTAWAVGQIYNRRRDIHAPFGGQRQSGIVTPSKYPAVFIFTGRGTPHGYADEWSADGTFRYFGEGQKGDMTLTKGNKAIANHAVNGKDLLLFDMIGGGRVRFRGPFNCAGYSFE